MRLIGVATAIAALLGVAVMAEAATPKTAWEQDILPPALPWHGKSEALIVGPSDPWITPSERDGLTTSIDYDGTRAFLEKMAAASPLIRVETFGRTAQGRDMLAAIVSKDGATLDPKKPVLLIQAGIHPGEIDGKDAGFMLLRDIAFKGRDGLIDKVNIVFVPIFNIDGHERKGLYSRPNQRGPVVQGWRTTAQNLNLNRDYAKLDSPEMRAMVGLIGKYDPALYLDIHVTDGVDYQYDVTFGFEGEAGRFTRSPAIAKWLDGTFKPAAYAALKREGHIPGELVFAVDDLNPKAGLDVGASSARFSQGYGDAAHVPAILIENHSLKPYRQRVLGTYVFLEASLKALADHGDAIRAAMTADRALRPAEVPANFKPIEKPVGEAQFLGVAFEKYASPVSGREEVRWLGRPDPKPWTMPLFSKAASVALKTPVAYWVPATKPEVIARLKTHGVRMETLDAPRTVTVQMARLPEARISGRVSEGHVPIDSGVPVWEAAAPRVMPTGSVRVPTDQPLGQLVVLLLDPQSDESFFEWGMFPEILERTEYMEGYVIAPLAQKMLDADPKLKAAFEARLAADPKFAADPEARLGWFYEQTPYADAQFRLYPVGREIGG